MRLKALKLKNFRAYTDETIITFDHLTALIGKNDIGKSSIMEALGIFFGSIKFDAGDRSVHAENAEVRIGCVFTDLPPEIILDTTAVTTLQGEYLLNEDGDLEIHKVFNDGTKESPVAIAHHPSVEKANDLLLLKQAELRKRLNEFGVDKAQVDERSNQAMRKAIWDFLPELFLRKTEIPLNKEDAKSLWERINKELPMFVLFKADRPSTDEDSEVQDPMKWAIKEALKEVEEELERIKEKVKDRALDVASRTLEHLQDFDHDLARELSPDFKSEPKWEGLFKLALTSDNQIPINKRGSGVRRLVLFSFFRAEAERRRLAEDRFSIIYAIEEPETSQHPDNQRMLVETFIELAANAGCQIVLTTHVPGLAELLPVESLRYVTKDESGNRVVRPPSEETSRNIARDLGVLPSPLRGQVEVIFCVEGKNDILFFGHMARLLRAHNPEIPDLDNDPRIVVIPMGGSSLKRWVECDYLSKFGRPEVHIYDRDEGTPPPYQAAADVVNGRNNGSIAFLTTKREAENYLHAAAINTVYGFQVEVTDVDDLPESVAKMAHMADASANPWDSLTEDKRKEKSNRAKTRLNGPVAEAMTYDQLVERNGKDDIESWLLAISERLLTATPQGV